MSPRGNNFMSNNTLNENCDIPGEDENVGQAQRTRSSISCKRSVVSIDTQKMRDSFSRLGRDQNVKSPQHKCSCKMPTNISEQETTEEAACGK